jgi:hypothetical protein
VGLLILQVAAGLLVCFWVLLVVLFAGFVACWPTFLLLLGVYKPCCGVLLLAAIAWQVVVQMCLWPSWLGSLDSIDFMFC